MDFISVRRAYIRILKMMALLSMLEVCILDPQQETKGETYLRLMETSVKDLGTKLAEIYPAQCSAVESCDLDSCSQDECLPLTGAITCVNVTSNARCSQAFPDSRPALPRSYERSGISYVRDGTLGGKPDQFQIKSICGTQALDETFKLIGSRNSYYTDYYVGLLDGSRRIFPGRHFQSQGEVGKKACYEYDCRRRPWYIGAISLTGKHLVILVDTTNKASDSATLEHSDTLNLTKLAAMALLDTLSEHDLVNVVEFGMEARALSNASVSVEYNSKNPKYSSELDELKMKTSEIKPNSVPSSSLGTGLRKALELFSATPCNASARHIVLLTSGEFANTTKLWQTVNDVVEKKIKLFIYSTIGPKDKNTVMSDLADNVGGIHSTLIGLKNLLYQMKSYFEYSAALHEETFGVNEPYWSPLYTDYYNAGEIVTVSLPVFSGTPRKFIGVAAIDIAYEELGDIVPSFQDALMDKKVTSTNSRRGDTLIRPFNDDEPRFDPCEEVATSNKIVMCPAPDPQTSSKYAFQDCCNLCADARICQDSESSTHRNTEKLIAAYVGSGIGGIGFIGLIVFFIWHRKRFISIRPDENTATEVASRSVTKRSTSTAPDTSQTQLVQFERENSKLTPHQINQVLLKLSVDKLED